MNNLKTLRRSMKAGARMGVLIALAALLAADGGLFTTARSESGALGTGGATQCWSPAQLRSRPEERLIRHSAAAPDLSQIKEFTPSASTPGKLRGSIRRVKLPPGKLLVALTFDLCESAGEIAGYDGAIVDYLRANRVPATFFAGGKWLMSHRERGAQLLADPLFEVGNHSWSHKNLRVLKGADMLFEITRASAAYAAVGAGVAESACARDDPRVAERATAPAKLFRFPYGVCSRESLDAVAYAGMLAIQWDVVTGDPFRGLTAEAMAREVMRTVKPGSIIVAHANGRGWSTAAALPLFIPALKAKGYKFVTVSELVAAGEPEIATDCYELKPGDNARYDALGKSVGGVNQTPRPAPKPRESGGLFGLF